MDLLVVIVLVLVGLACIKYVFTFPWFLFLLCLLGLLGGWSTLSNPDRVATIAMLIGSGAVGTWRSLSPQQQAEARGRFRAAITRCSQAAATKPRPKPTPTWVLVLIAVGPFVVLGLVFAVWALLTT